MHRNILSHIRPALLGLVLACANTYAAADVLVGRVVGLADGDTLTVLDEHHVQHKIRIAAIDAPERRQPFGSRSRANLAALVMGKSVEVEWRKTDRYGRIVGTVRAGQLDAGFEQIRAGLAWHYKAYSKEQAPAERAAYAAAEHEAREQRKGLWLDPQPEAPWDFRAEKRSRHGS